MKLARLFVCLFFTLSLQSCSQWIPAVGQALDDAVTDEAIGVTVDKAAMQKDTDVKITVDVINKMQPGK